MICAEDRGCGIVEESSVLSLVSELQREKTFGIT